MKEDLRKNKIKTRVRRKINPKGQLRLSVFRSNKHIFAQILDDKKGITLASISDLDRELKKEAKGLKKSELAGKVGELLAQKALAQKIEKVVFDRGCFIYHGRIKALAEGARKAGLKF